MSPQSVRLILWSGFGVMLFNPATSAQEVEPPAVFAAKQMANRELVEVAKRAYEMTEASWEVGMATIEDLLDWSERWMQAELALGKNRKDETKAVTDHLGRVQKLQRKVTRETFPAVEYHKLKGELLLVKFDPQAAKKFEEQSSERSQLQGVWEVATAEEEGKPAEIRDFDQIVIRGRAARFGGSQALVDINPSKEPKQINVYGWNGDYAYGFNGIYKLSDDVLTICWEQNSLQRPEEFSSAGEKPLRLYTLKRIKERASLRD